MIFYILLSILIGLLTYLCVKSHKRHGYWNERGVKTAPSVLPVIGHAYGMLIKPMRWLYTDELYRKFKVDGMWGMFEWKDKLNLHVVDPEIIRDVTMKESDHFIDRRLYPLNNKYFKEFVTLLEGDKWKALRSILTPTFSSEKLKGMFSLVQEKTKDLIARSKQEMDQVGCIDAKDICNLFAMDVISTCAFGLNVKCLMDKEKNSRFLKSATDVMETNTKKVLKIILLGLIPLRISKALGFSFKNDSQDYLVQVLNEAYEERVKSGLHRGDYLDLLIEAKEKNDKEENEKEENEKEENEKEENDKEGNEKKFEFTPITVVSQALLFLLAGFDTTSSALTIIFHHLAKNPSEQDILRKHLEKILEADGEFNYQNVMECEYIDAVMNESLRLNPVGYHIERRCVQDFRVKSKEFTIEKGTMVSIPIYSLHRDPQYWEEPEAFKPERFFAENKSNIVPYTFMPFGSGPRNCIAMGFAMMEIKLGIAEMCTKFELSIKAGHEELVFDHSAGRADGVTKPSVGAVMIELKPLKSDV